MDRLGPAGPARLRRRHAPFGRRTRSVCGRRPDRVPTYVATAEALLALADAGVRGRVLRRAWSAVGQARAVFEECGADPAGASVSPARIPRRAAFQYSALSERAVGAGGA